MNLPDNALADRIESMAHRVRNEEDKTDLLLAARALRSSPPEAVGPVVAWKFRMDGVDQVMLDEDADINIRRNGTPLYAQSAMAPHPEREALAFFMATALGDGYFDDDHPIKERVRAWLLDSANRIRDDITVAEVVESVVGLDGGGQRKGEG